MIQSNLNHVSNGNINNGHVSSNGTKASKSNESGVNPSGNALQEITKSYQSILHHVGEDPYREGLLKTPERAAKALLFFTKGYQENLKGELVITT